MTLPTSLRGHQRRMPRSAKWCSSLIVLSIFSALLAYRVVEAQTCGCVPRPKAPGVEPYLHYTIDSSASPFEPAITSAAIQWNNLLAASGSSKQLSNSYGTDYVVIKVDPAVCDGTTYASTQAIEHQMRICPDIFTETPSAYVTRTWLHEFGRMLGLGYSDCDPATTVMTQVDPAHMGNATTVLGSADSCYVQQYIRDPDPEPEPDACQLLIDQGFIINGGFYAGPCLGDNQTEYEVAGCCVGSASPLVLSLSAEPISFSSASAGVPFDIAANGKLFRVAWPVSRDTVWLAYDRNGDGRIGDGTELFGTSTPVGSGLARNGFEALREFDSNGDGKIDRGDERFNELLIWRDENRNGISEAGELSRLADVGITEISLAYTASRHRDRWGNLFHYRAEARAIGAPTTRQIYDVYPKMIPLQ